MLLWASELESMIPRKMMRLMSFASSVCLRLDGPMVCCFQRIDFHGRLLMSRHENVICICSQVSD